MHKVLWYASAWEDYLYWQNQDKKTLKRINELIKDIMRNGYDRKGKPEPLKGNLAGYWSVRIDDKNRIVFLVEEEDGPKACAGWFPRTKSRARERRRCPRCPRKTTVTPCSCAHSRRCLRSTKTKRTILSIISAELGLKSETGEEPRALPLSSAKTETGRTEEPAAMTGSPPSAVDEPGRRDASRIMSPPGRNAAGQYNTAPANDLTEMQPAFSHASGKRLSGPKETLRAMLPSAKV